MRVRLCNEWRTKTSDPQIFWCWVLHDHLVLRQSDMGICRAMELAEEQDECDKSDACSSSAEEQNLGEQFDGQMDGGELQIIKSSRERRIKN